MAPRGLRGLAGSGLERQGDGSQDEFIPVDRPPAATAVVAAPPLADRPTGVGWTERLG